MKGGQFLKKNAAVFTVALLLLAACNDTAPGTKSGAGKDSTTPASEPHFPELVKTVVNTTGIPEERLQYREKEKEFIVDGDGIITVQDAKVRFENGQSKPISRHKKHYYIIAAPKERNITLWCDGTVPAEWISALDSAIRNWNAAGSSVRMSRISNSRQATTRVGTNRVVSSTIAAAAYPDYYGNPGNRMTINRHLDALPLPKKIFALTHELGHIIGFSHTNQKVGEHIEGTPESDPRSVMNATVQNWSGFTPFDLEAVRKIYPRE